MSAPVRIAMWSGPRNLSTALLRSFEARGDCAVVDEPLYAAYLATTGKAHPGRDAVLSSRPTDARAVALACTDAPVPDGVALQYQKHMAHHLVGEQATDPAARAWVRSLRNAFLLREPARMLASLTTATPDATLEDTGLPQQVALFEELVAAGCDPPVVDSADLLAAPGPMLAALCARLGVEYTDRMLSWEPGRRPTDGVWAEHWYAAVERSTGFGPPDNRPVELDARYADLLAACEPLHARLHARRLTL